MPGELFRDEVLQSPTDLFCCDVCFKVLDAIITSIDIRFNDSQEILKDLSLLAPEHNMLSIKTKSKLPSSAFEQLSNWIDIDINKLQSEYLTFSNSLNDIFNDNYSTTTSIYNDKNNDRTDQPDFGLEISDDSEIEEASTTKMSSLDILGLLSSHNLITAFPNFYLAYKALCVIPASSASAEHSFSKVIFIIIS